MTIKFPSGIVRRHGDRIFLTSSYKLLTHCFSNNSEFKDIAGLTLELILNMCIDTFLN